MSAGCIENDQLHPPFNLTKWLQEWLDTHIWRFAFALVITFFLGFFVEGARNTREVVLDRSWLVLITVLVVSMNLCFPRWHTLRRYVVMIVAFCVFLSVPYGMLFGIGTGLFILGQFIRRNTQPGIQQIEEWRFDTNVKSWELLERPYRRVLPRACEHCNASGTLKFGDLCIPEGVELPSTKQRLVNPALVKKNVFQCSACKKFCENRTGDG